jgi:hypothetical protein
LPDQLLGQGVQAIHVAIGVNASILDVLPFQPSEILHSLHERRAQLSVRCLRSERQPSDTTDGRGRLSATEWVRDEQADGTCQ